PGGDRFLGSTKRHGAVSTRRVSSHAPSGLHVRPVAWGASSETSSSSALPRWHGRSGSRSPPAFVAGTHAAGNPLAGSIPVARSPSPVAGRPLHRANVFSGGD